MALKIHTKLDTTLEIFSLGFGFNLVCEQGSKGDSDLSCHEPVGIIKKTLRFSDFGVLSIVFYMLTFYNQALQNKVISSFLKSKTKNEKQKHSVT